MPYDVIRRKQIEAIIKEIIGVASYSFLIAQRLLLVNKWFFKYIGGGIYLINNIKVLTLISRNRTLILVNYIWDNQISNKLSSKRFW